MKKVIAEKTLALRESFAVLKCPKMIVVQLYVYCVEVEVDLGSEMFRCQKNVLEEGTVALV